MQHNPGTLQFDREGLKLYKDMIARAKADNHRTFVHAGNLVELHRAEELVKRLEAAFGKEPEADRVNIPNF